MKAISTRQVLMVLGVLVFGLSAGSGCVARRGGGNDPKTRLQDYISLSFSVASPEDREALSRFLIGPAKTRLAAWSDDQFRAAFLANKRQFVNLVFSEVKTVSPREVNITYELTYLDQSKGHDAKVTHRKQAEMKQDQNQWYITEVRNLKELIEYKNEMALP